MKIILWHWLSHWSGAPLRSYFLATESSSTKTLRDASCLWNRKCKTCQCGTSLKSSSERICATLVYLSAWTSHSVCFRRLVRTWLFQAPVFSIALLRQMTQCYARLLQWLAWQLSPRTLNIERRNLLIQCLERLLRWWLKIIAILLKKLCTTQSKSPPCRSRAKTTIFTNIS